MVSWRSATIRSPLRSNRARTSPVSPRSKASGFTRIKVLDCSATARESTGAASGGACRQCEGERGKEGNARALAAHDDGWERYDAVAGRGRSSGEPPSRPLPDPDWLREEGLRCLVAGASLPDWPRLGEPEGDGRAPGA